MCYRCATNPSIHHRRRHVAAVLSLLSHHGVTFAVALLWFHCCHHDVAFVITLSRFRHCHHGVAFVSVTVLSSLSWCHLRVGHGFVVAVTVSPSSSHCHSFVIIVVLPSLSH